MRMAPLFIATKRFDPSDSKRWNEYINWAKIPALVEVVSLDCLLCPHLVNEFTDEDWSHIVNENFRLNYFHDLNYLLERVATVKNRNILGLYRNSDQHISHPPSPAGFEFIGYDLIEEMTQISALTNCGGFPDAFSNSELNRFGLLSDFIRARDVRINLLKQNPDEPRANCEMYAVWRLKELQE